jgi:hypothetical protein
MENNKTRYQEINIDLEAFLFADRDIQEEIRQRLVNRVITPAQYAEEMRLVTLNFRQGLRDLALNQLGYDDVPS